MFYFLPFCFWLFVALSMSSYVSLFVGLSAVGTSFLSDVIYNDEITLMVIPKNIVLLIVSCRLFKIVLAKIFIYM
jgi:flagellar biosynthesis protein FliQ